MIKTRLSLLALLIAHNVNAESLQKNEAIDENNMERIVVTGSRIVESIDEVPASITIINRQQIEAQLKVSTELQTLLATLVPGLAPSTGTSSNSSQTLRGRSPLVMIDGVPQSTPLRNGALGIRTIDANALERIEVIKGATSIYGNGAAGGIINYITKKANSDSKLSGKISVASRFSAVKTGDSVGQRVEGMINGQLDKFSYVASASYEDNGVQRDAEGDVIGLKYGLSEASMQNYFTKLGYQFNDDISLQFVYNYYESKQDSNLVDVVGSVNSGVKTYAIEAPSGTSAYGEPQGPNNHNMMLKYTDVALFENTQLVIDAYAQEVENIFFYSPTLANLDEGYTGGQSLIKSDKEGLRVTLNSQFDWDNVEATFIYGIDTLNDVTSQPLVDGRVWVPEMDMENLAGFLQSKWVVQDNFIIKAGIRREKIDLAVSDYRTLKLCKKVAVCSIPIDVTGDTLNYRATTYNFGIRYNVADYFQPFASYSQGSDISDIGRLLRTSTVTDIALIQTEASIIDNYEIGFTSEIDKLRLEFSAYRSTSELGTTNKYDPATGVYMPVRAPQEIYGYEAVAFYNFSKEIDITATYAWVEGKNTENDTYLGAKQISAPKATININWQPIDNTNLALSYLYVGDRKKFDPVDGKYVGDKGPIDSYHVFNMSGNYSFNQDWTAFIGIENLFNQDYYPAKSQAYTYSGYNVKGLGTTVNMGVDYQF
ncbi:TonB-dependent receptor [Colwellia hornerae]|uniref:TonB-dependent receptor n=1 Tax=Colwellia hornerae TaxID=89402 RepID=A0A5C6QNN8_9GAMM|nr:TonB-dependent receptor [Colwellia hornerae]TWX54630.1 TonB-dependent receptor [Colwellia hornerae]TWX61070.1 TonB-dependent receptor [Colwellia hornerae]TWX70323.1 TonB-dependent receptor [Colwellia hornerae]